PTLLVAILLPPAPPPFPYTTLFRSWTAPPTADLPSVPSRPDVRRMGRPVGRYRRHRGVHHGPRLHRGPDLQPHHHRHNARARTAAVLQASLRRRVHRRPRRGSFPRGEEPPFRALPLPRRLPVEASGRCHDRNVQEVGQLDGRSPPACG